MVALCVWALASSLVSLGYAQVGGGQVGNGAADTASGSTIAGTNTALSSALATETYGPWSSKEYLEGTWVSKSGMVVTGPDFFDPVDELLIEPALPGISYSFTKDGYWEQATYSITANGTDPLCATAALIYQHGTYELMDNGTLVCTPFEVDGRMLLSDPCKESSSNSVYMRYNQVMTFKQFSVYVDMYHGRYRLDLQGYDGTPVMPLYLAYKPPQMLPTITMKPTPANTTNEDGTESTSAASSETSGSSSANTRMRVRRALINRARTGATRDKTQTPYVDALWYLGVTMMGAGAVGWWMLS